MLLFDRIDIQTEREYTAEGFLTLPASIARAGVQEYTAYEVGMYPDEPERVVNVYRPAESVFADMSMQSFASKPVTNGHPPVMLDTSNTKEYMVGMSADSVARKDNLMVTKLTITDADCIADIVGGKAELSNGYNADLRYEKGVTDVGEAYEAIQENILGNHIAIVVKGKAGVSCRLADTKKLLEGELMKVNIDGIEYEMPDQAAQAVKKLQDRLKDMEAEASKNMAEAEDAKETMQAELDSAISKVPGDAAIDKLVEDRLTLVKDVQKVCPDVVCTNKSASDLKKEVVAAKCPTIKVADSTEAYIQARFDLLVEDSGTDAAKQIADALATANKSTQTDDKRSPSQIARDEYMKRTSNAWKPKGEV